MVRYLKGSEVLRYERQEMMIATILSERRWNHLQGPSRPTRLPNGYLLLLAALDEGWKVDRILVQPSWDQHGFVYVLTLKRSGSCRRQELVLPKNPQVEALLMQEHFSASRGIPSSRN